MSDPQLILGVHVNKVSTVVSNKKSTHIHDAISRDINTLSLNAAQVFTHGPRGYNAVIMDNKEVKNVVSEVDLTVHSGYPTVSIWHITNENVDDAKSKRSIGYLKAQLAACKQIDAWGMVLHVTRHKPEQIAYVMKNIIKPVAKQINVKIILEMVSSKADPNLTYETPHKINRLTKMIGCKESWWCWCIDTAHLWGAGVDISLYNDMKNWLNGIKYTKKIKLFHLNGSYAAKGSGKDKHEIVFNTRDKIWGNVKPKLSGVKAVVDYATINRIPMICEINRGDADEVKKGIKLIKKLSMY